MPFFYALQVILAIAALVACLRTPADELPGRIPRPLWLILILIIPLIGPIAWFVISWSSRAERASTDGTVEIPRNPLEMFRQGKAKKSEPEQVPPDDNPDFLFSLEAQMRRRKMAEEAARAEAEKQARKKQREAEQSKEGETGETIELDHPDEN